MPAGRIHRSRYLRAPAGGYQPWLRVLYIRYPPVVPQDERCKERMVLDRKQRAGRLMIHPPAGRLASHPLRLVAGTEVCLERGAALAGIMQPCGRPGEFWHPKWLGERRSPFGGALASLERLELFSHVGVREIA